MSGPNLLERVRMCLAEVGVNTDCVVESSGVIRFTGVDDRVAWRAVEIARNNSSRTWCFACRMAAPRNFTDKDEMAHARDACTAALPLTEDCGITRS